jgi:hypothetical protein
VPREVAARTLFPNPEPPSTYWATNRKSQENRIAGHQHGPQDCAERENEGTQPSALTKKCGISSHRGHKRNDGNRPVPAVKEFLPSGETSDTWHVIEAGYFVDFRFHCNSESLPMRRSPL